MTVEIGLLLGILGVALVFFSTDWIPADVVGLGVLAAMLVTGALPLDRAFAGFGSDTFVMILGVADSHSGTDSDRSCRGSRTGYPEAHRQPSEPCPVDSDGRRCRAVCRNQQHRCHGVLLADCHEPGDSVGRERSEAQSLARMSALHDEPSYRNVAHPCGSLKRAIY